jgi:histidinol dehydrogenase
MNLNMQVIETSEPLRDRQVLALRGRLRNGLTAEQSAPGQVEQIVREILADVGARMDAALIDWERKLDGAELTVDSLRVPVRTIQAAHEAAEPGSLDLVRRAVANIRQFQETILVKDPPALHRGGRQLSVRYGPISRIGMYVPGGKAIYPSSMLMTLVPALVAGVPSIALACPPRTNGDVHPLILAIACELGIAEVYRLGGAVAMAALAIGTPTVQPVDKLFGPGSAFVTEAKRQLFGRIGIDSMAGPSEVLILADASAEPAWVAADMLAQAEHNPAAAILVTTSKPLAESVLRNIEEQLVNLERQAAARRCLEAYGAIIIVPDLEAACAVANDLACEHVQIMTSQDEEVLASIRNTGAIFVGPCSAVALGDYYAGPSHVLPTGGTARFFSPLNCNDFRRMSSIIRYDRQAVAADANDVAALAGLEGLTAHAESVRIRTQDITGATP